MRQLLVSFALCFSLSAAFGQGSVRSEKDVFDVPRTATLKELFSGKPFPMSKKLKELDQDWARVTVYGQPDTPNSAQSMPTIFRRIGGETVYYTKGETVQVGSETYAITYRVKQRAASASKARVARDSSVPQEQDRMTQNSTLSLTLLNLRTSGNFTDIRPFNLTEELEGESVIETELPDEPLIVAKHTSRETQKHSAKNIQTELTPENVKPITETKTAHIVEETEKEPVVEAHESSTKVIKVTPAGSPELASVSNLSQIGSAIVQYLEDYNEIFPPMRNRSDFKTAIASYLKNEAALLNPLTKEPYVLNDILSEHKLAHISNPTTFIVAYEAEAASDSTRGVVFVDGKAKRVPEEEWSLWKKRSKIP